MCWEKIAMAEINKLCRQIIESNAIIIFHEYGEAGQPTSMRLKQVGLFDEPIYTAMVRLYQLCELTCIKIEFEPVDFDAYMRAHLAVDAFRLAAGGYW